MDQGVGQEHPDLAALRPPGGPRVLPLHPGRPGALLDEPGLISDQHPLRIAQVLDDIVPHVVADLTGIPVRPGGREHLPDHVGARGYRTPRAPGYLFRLCSVRAEKTVEGSHRRPSVS